MEDVVKPLMTNDFSNVANTLVIATKPASNKTFFDLHPDGAPTDALLSRCCLNACAIGERFFALG